MCQARIPPSNVSLPNEAALGLLRASGSTHLILLHLSETKGGKVVKPVRVRRITITESPLHSIILNITCNWGHDRLQEFGVVDLDDTEGPEPLSNCTSIIVSTRLLDTAPEPETDEWSARGRSRTEQMIGAAEYRVLQLDQSIPAVLREIVAGPDNKNLLDAYRTAKFSELLCLLSPSYIARDRTDTSTVKLTARDLRALSALKDFLHTADAASLTLRQLALRFGLNRNKLAHGFKTIYGMTVMNYRRRVRLLKALDFLQKDDMQISQVADAVGFQYPCNFSTAFKEEFGCTPKELRKSITALGCSALVPWEANRELA